jgi:glycosyltransferase involved in cell wall biosynthesis
MTRIALLSSEPIRPRMAGIGIRYLELARRLPGHGIETLLVSPAPADPAGSAAPAVATDPAGSAASAAPAASADLAAPDISPDSALDLGGAELRRFERGRLADLLRGCDGAVAQGQLANDLLLELPELPAAIDLYDPWLIENLAYHRTLGLDPYRNDHATWVLQMTRGDFFLCSSEEQRAFYLGFLTAVGRVNPERVAADADLRSLIDVVPFGVPDELPAHRPYLPPRRAGEARLLFGGLYDWYDPWTLLAALERLAHPDWTLLLVRNPNAGSTPQRLLAEVERDCRRRGWWGSRVQALDWVPSDRRYDLLRDVDLLVAPHRPSLETALSLRTRFLDALAAGCPVVVSEGGAMSRLLAARRAAWLVPPGDAAALAAALAGALARPAEHREGAAALAAEYRWDRVIAPLLEFCAHPRRDAAKERFAHRPPTVAPADRLRLRLARRWRRLGRGRGPRLPAGGAR